LALDDKYDDIKKLIDTGKEKGYLTYDQVNDLIPHDVHSPEDLDDLLTTIGTQGIDVLEGPKGLRPRSIKNSRKWKKRRGRRARPHPRRSGKNQRSRPHVPARDGNRAAAHARRRSRNRQAHRARPKLRVLKALSRSPIVINELLADGRGPQKGVRSIKEVVTFDEEEITDEISEPAEGISPARSTFWPSSTKRPVQSRKFVESFAEEASQGPSPLPPQPGARGRVARRRRCASWASPTTNASA
jgi:RNA polymerase primary sigma factor